MSHADLCEWNCNLGECDCDGYHTWNELYEHRHQLFLALCRLNGGWRSMKHADGTMYDGWFIVGTENADLRPITYHLPIRLWNECDNVDTLPLAPEWDGYTSQDVLERLKRIGQEYLDIYDDG